MLSVKRENLAESLVAQKVSSEEFQKAKTTVLAEMSQKNSVDYWLDVDTYKLVSVKEEMRRINDVALTDVQRVAEAFQKQSFVKVWLLNQAKNN
jgi:predicted Zn-dependent peptidase